MKGKPKESNALACCGPFGTPMVPRGVVAAILQDPLTNEQLPLLPHMRTEPLSIAIDVWRSDKTQKSNIVPRTPIVAVGVVTVYALRLLFPDTKRNDPPMALMLNWLVRLLLRLNDASTVIVEFGPTAIFVPSLKSS